MYKIPWNVLNRMLIDASYFDDEALKDNNEGNESKQQNKGSKIALTDENADELLNIMLGKAKLK